MLSGLWVGSEPDWSSLVQPGPSLVLGVVLPSDLHGPAGLVFLQLIPYAKSTSREYA